MATLWMDPFDDYVGSVARMLNGPWAQVDTVFSFGAGFSLSTAKSRTGAYSLACGGGDRRQARRIFGAPKATVGLAGAYYFTALPETNNRIGWSFNNAGNTEQTILHLQSTGTLELFTGGVSRGVTDSPPVVAGAWQHIELKPTIATSGAFEARVDGVTYLNLSTVTNGSGGSETSQFRYGTFNDQSGVVMYTDDMHAWDTVSGQGLEDFGGNLAVLRRALIADRTEADFTLVGGVDGFELLDDHDDATLLRSSVVGDRSRFHVEPFDASVLACLGNQLNIRGLKTDSGDATVQLGIRSLIDDTETMTSDIPLTTVPTTWSRQLATSPSTGVDFAIDEDIDLIIERTL